MALTMGASGTCLAQHTPRGIGTNDGTPDLFDRDDDNDGVPDNLDMSPHTILTTTFTKDQPFSLIIDRLTPGKLTYVEFQVNPVITQHLWYAHNVLDWPKDDRQGQIQDDDGKTFYDLDTSLDPNPSNNGDLKLLPMLEIMISGSTDNLPPTSTLQSVYGIYVQPYPGTDKKAVYVPLQLVTDNRGGARVAFYGKMVYLPGAAWGAAQQVRMIWTVQALVDVCDEYADGVCTHYSKHNDPQIVHVYPDEWRLTGLNVRENHGSDVAVIYEDPQVDPDRNDDAQLQLLTYGLDRTFLAARVNANGQRDFTVAELYRRFNRTTNGGVSEQERWGITNTLAVTIGDLYAPGRSVDDARHDDDEPGAVPVHAVLEHVARHTHAALCARGSLSHRQPGCLGPGQRRVLDRGQPPTHA